MDKLTKRIIELEDELYRLKKLKKSPDFEIGKIYTRKGTNNNYAFIDWNGEIRLLNISNSTFWKPKNTTIVKSRNYRLPYFHNVLSFPMWAAVEAFSSIVEELTLKE